MSKIGIIGASTIASGMAPHAITKAIILHGTLGSPAGNWFRWLATELQKAGLEVWLPQLPHAEQPSVAEWAVFVQSNCPYPIDETTLIVGHSSGAILALILAQQNATSIAAIAAVLVFDDNSLQWEPNNRLFDVAFDYLAIKAHVGKLLFIHSDNDPYVPLPQAERVAQGCDSQTVVMPGQGHFNLEQSPEYHEFPALLQLLQTKAMP